MKIVSTHVISTLRFNKYEHYKDGYVEFDTTEYQWHITRKFTSLYKHWNGNIILIKFSPLNVPKWSFLTIFDAANDDPIVKNDDFSISLTHISVVNPILINIVGQCGLLQWRYSDRVWLKIAGAKGVSAGSSLARLRHRWWKVRSFLCGKFSSGDGTA